jgi:hypothetical protein
MGGRITLTTTLKYKKNKYPRSRLVDASIITNSKEDGIINHQLLYRKKRSRKTRSRPCKEEP